MDEQNFEKLCEEVKNCQNCELCYTRHNAVFGEGKLATNVIFVGEAPGKTEDELGLPFVGRSGQLIDRMLTAVGLSRNKNIFITNIIKCRPPNNSDPTPEQQEVCTPYLRRQIEMINPKLIVCVGRIAAQYFLGAGFKVTKDHGKIQKLGDRYVVGTFHPAALLRTPGRKEAAFADLIVIADWLRASHISSDI